MYFLSTSCGKSEKLKKMETMTMVIGSNDAKFRYPFKFLTTYYRQTRFDIGIFLDILACQK